MRFLILLPLLFAMPVAASTFVGNGGFAGDVILQVTVREVQDTMKIISERKDDKLCVCYQRLEGHPICETLKKLTPDKVEFCAKYLKENAGAINSALQSSKVNWTEDSISVNEGGSLRAADAVTHFEAQQMTLQKERFLDMQDYERVFLLTHESGHLMKFEGKPIQDKQAIGPFKDEEGGREFLNAVAAATVMEAINSNVMNKYKGDLKRSYGRAKFWVDLDIEGGSAPKESSEKYVVGHMAGGRVALRYYFTDSFGVGVQYRELSGSENILSNTSIHEKTTATAVFGSYRFFPFSNPMSYLGQSHLVATLGVESLKGEYKIADNFISADATASSNSLTVGCNYYLPLRKGFWISAGLGYLGHHFSYNIPNTEVNNKTNFTINTGVAYGF